VTPGDIGDPSPFYNFPATSGTTCPNPAPTDAESHFCTNWINYPSSSYETLGVYFDSFDIVHLKGLVKHVGPFVSEHIILELPSFFCGWDHDKIFPALASGQLARLDVALHHISGTGVNACDVSVSNDATIANDYLSLDGITWSVNQKNAGDAPPKVAPKKP
jgi:hypothetical protein